MLVLLEGIPRFTNQTHEQLDSYLVNLLADVYVSSRCYLLMLLCLTTTTAHSDWDADLTVTSPGEALRLHSCPFRPHQRLYYAQELHLWQTQFMFAIHILPIRQSYYLVYWFTV